MHVERIPVEPGQDTRIVPAENNGTDGPGGSDGN